jgi:hypothetical protein
VPPTHAANEAFAHGPRSARDGLLVADLLARCARSSAGNCEGRRKSQAFYVGSRRRLRRDAELRIDGGDRRLSLECISRGSGV